MVSIVPKNSMRTGPVGFRRIHVENSAAPRELPRHFDDIHLRVAHARQMRGQRLEIDLLPRLSVTARPA